MSLHSLSLSLSPLLPLFLITISTLTRPSTSAVDSFVYGGCSQLKYNPGTPYESNVNSMLTSFVNSAAFAIFNKFKISVPGSSAGDVIYGLFQCRGDVGTPNCRDCVAKAVSQLGVLCPNSAGGALQLDGCFVKYDNTSFLGVEDKTLVMKKCGTSVDFDSDALTRRDAVMGNLAAGGQYFRVGGSGDIQGVAQCVQDLSGSECQDCLNEAIGRLKSECGSAAFGDMFLGKCYVRYTDRGDHSNGGYNNNNYHNDHDHDHDNDHDNDDNSNDDEVERTLAILIGVIVVVAVLIAGNSVSALPNRVYKQRQLAESTGSSPSAAK
ncbi:hypothetical protein RHGRI_026648 [Rhododendron griersonianum]|uniref:Gnk2-homologous domain-containing protein n=1 Tax=Rhododendron griersonianum TaxID=479676 RepID=A0AAV6IUL1_9ERIC|nr:hypothetical protein RHGRI_026648 [Rhododendron griersonianum]